MKRFVFILVFFLESLVAFGQQAWTVLNTSTSTIPDNTIKCLTIDSYNRKWIGTEFGLAVFNDSNFTVYQTTNSGLPDNHVRCIFIDNKNIKWIGTQNGGLTKFNDTTWVNYNTTNSTLPDNSVKSITQDVAGLLWIGTTGGLVKFNGNKFTAYNMFNSLLMSDNISDVYADTNNTKLICTLNGGLSLAVDTVYTTYTITNSGFPDNSIVAVDKDDQGLFWFASPASGLIAYLGGTNWFNYNISNSGLPINSLTDIDCHQNAIWITTTGGGLVFKHGLNFDTFTTSNSLLPDNYTNCVTVDSSGIVWIGTASAGLVKLSPTMLSAHDYSFQKKLQVFPNPATDLVYINSTDEKITSIKLFDMDGKQCKILKAGFFNNISLGVMDLSSGIYLFKIEFSNGSVSFEKILKN